RRSSSSRCATKLGCSTEWARSRTASPKRAVARSCSRWQNRMARTRSAPRSGTSTESMRSPSRRRSASHLASFENGEDVAGWVLEPGDGWTTPLAVRDSLRIGLDVGEVVVLETDTALLQVVDGELNVVDGEVQHGKRGRLVILLRIEEDRRPAGWM